MKGVMTRQTNQIKKSDLMKLLDIPKDYELSKIHVIGNCDSNGVAWVEYEVYGPCEDFE